MDELNEKIEGLVKKAEKSKMPYSILKKVYDRGMAAWRTGHRPGTTPQQWAFARVNSFITKSSGTWGKADKDLAKQVRGEEVEKRTTAKKMLGQVREKLPKDADAGDYVKDFRKSDAPQFKGKSDKKIQKMAIAAYLDDKDKKESIKENLLIHTKDDRVTDQLAYHLQDLQGRGRSNISDIDLDNVYNHHKNKYVKGRINVEIDGSRSDSQKLIKDLQKKYGTKIKVSLDMGEEVDMQEASEFEIQVFMLGKILQKHPKFTDEMYDNFNNCSLSGAGMTLFSVSNKNFDSNIAHEATTSKISEEQLHYCQQRGLNPEEAVGLIVNGFCKEVLQQLPMEFAVEAQKLVGISLEGSVG